MTATNSDKQTLITTGLFGLVGSKFDQLYGKKYACTNLDISHPTHRVDITDFDQVQQALSQNRAPFLLHLAAFTDVTKAWEQRDDKTGLAYKVNVEGTRNIVKACEQNKIHLIHVSTAFVFDGEKTGLYTEEDTTRPIEWYGQTKAEAEAIVQAADCPWTILRIDFPFRSDSFVKPDIVRKTVSALEKGYPLFTDHYFGPTFIDDFAKVIDWVIRTGTTGLFNASSGEQWSDFQLGERLKDILPLPFELKAGDLDSYLKTLNRPYQRNTALDCRKLKSQLDFSLSSIEEALHTVIL